MHLQVYILGVENVQHNLTFNSECLTYTIANIHLQRYLYAEIGRKRGFTRERVFTDRFTHLLGAYDDMEF